MAVYNFQYGMTDKRKPEFKIQIYFDNKTLSQQPSEFYSDYLFNHDQQTYDDEMEFQS